MQPLLLEEITFSFVWQERNALSVSTPTNFLILLTIMVHQNFSKSQVDADFDTTEPKENLSITPREFFRQKLDQVVHRSSKKILYVLQQEFPDSAQTVDLAAKVGIHRATVSIRSNELHDLGLIEKGILAGTEQKYNPTYLFRLPDDLAESEELDYYLNRWIEEYPTLVTTEDMTEDEEDNNITQLLELQEAENVSIPSDDDPDFEGQISLIVIQMAEQIVDLQERVTELEEQLQKRKKRQQKPDLSQALHLLNSLNKKT